MENDPSFQRMVQRSLRAAGYEILTAGDVPTALTIVEEDQPDALIADLALGVQEGNELLAGMRLYGRTVPMLLISSGAATNHLAQLENGRTAVLDTPFEIEALLSSLNFLLKAEGQVAGRPNLARSAEG